MSYLTDAELLAAMKLHRDTPYVYQCVSHGFLSIARHTGGIIVNGQSYTYSPEHDECIRDDVLKMVRKMRRNCRKCGGAMKPGIATGQTVICGDEGTCSPAGPGYVQQCLKCEACGWSVTAERQE